MFKRDNPTDVTISEFRTPVTDVGDSDKIRWTETHESIGTNVAARFFPTQSQKRGRIYFGVVKQFAPESSSGKKDQLYHIVWQDGDEQDYDEEELAAGKALYEKKQQKSSSAASSSSSLKST